MMDIRSWINQPGAGLPEKPMTREHALVVGRYLANNPLGPRVLLGTAGDWVWFQTECFERLKYGGPNGREMRELLLFGIEARQRPAVEI